jgi:hypothetical protein
MVKKKWTKPSDAEMDRMDQEDGLSRDQFMAKVREVVTAQNEEAQYFADQLKAYRKEGPHYDGIEDWRKRNGR